MRDTKKLAWERFVKELKKGGELNRKKTVYNAKRNEEAKKYGGWRIKEEKWGKESKKQSRVNMEKMFHRITVRDRRKLEHNKRIEG